MNCKPGDLAIVMRGPKNRGRIVRCIRVLPEFSEVLTQCGRPARTKDDAGPTWLVEGWVLYNAPPYGWVELPFASDSMLRPIDNPSDDAQDQTLSWLPVPMPEIIPAMLDREVEHG